MVQGRKDEDGRGGQSRVCLKSGSGLGAELARELSGCQGSEVGAAKVGPGPGAVRARQRWAWEILLTLIAWLIIGVYHKSGQGTLWYLSLSLCWQQTSCRRIPALGVPARDANDALELDEKSKVWSQRSRRLIESSLFPSLRATVNNCASSTAIVQLWPPTTPRPRQARAGVRARHQRMQTADLEVPGVQRARARRHE